MNPTYKKYVQAVTYYAGQLLAMYGILSQLNVLWSGTPSYQTHITDTVIQSDPGYLGSGLTAQNIADAEYALTQVKIAMDNAMVALTILANQ